MPATRLHATKTAFGTRSAVLSDAEISDILGEKLVGSTSVMRSFAWDSEASIYHQPLEAQQGTHRTCHRPWSLLDSEQLQLDPTQSSWVACAAQNALELTQYIDTYHNSGGATGGYVSQPVSVHVYSVHECLTSCVISEKDATLQASICSSPKQSLIPNTGATQIMLRLLLHVGDW